MRHTGMGNYTIGKCLDQSPLSLSLSLFQPWTKLTDTFNNYGAELGVALNFGNQNSIRYS
jgi:hypothetical protein